MARHLIQSSATGDTRIVGDAALAFFAGYVVVDTLDDGVASTVFFTGGESDLRFVNVSEISDPASAASIALKATLVPFWAPSEVVATNAIRVNASGQIIKRNTSGTTRATYDATEQGLWTVVSSGGGGGATTSASDLTSGTLAVARIADGSLTAAKMAGDVATQAELDAAYTSAIARVNHTGTQTISTVTGLQAALDAKATLIVSQTSQTGTTYTLALADSGSIVELSNAAAITLTVPPNSSVAFPVGTVIGLRQMGAGQVTVAPGAGVTVSSRGAALKFNGQYSEGSLTKRATDQWVLSGDLTT